MATQVEEQQRQIDDLTRQVREITERSATTSALMVRQQAQLAPLEFDQEQREIIKDQCAKGATDNEFKALMAIAGAKRLNPLKRQIYFRKQSEWDQEQDKYVERWICITGIDGFRVIADRTGLYNGQDEPEFIYEEGEPCGKCQRRGKTLLLARVKVYRKDIDRAFVGVARYEEFVQTKRNGEPNKMWLKMPHSQLAKCAEALAFRKAFSDDLGDIYAPEEFPQDETAGAASTADRMSVSAQPAAPVPGAPVHDAEIVADQKPPAGAMSSAEKIALWQSKFEKAGNLAAVITLSQEAAKEPFTAAERKEVVASYGTWRRHFEQIEKRKAAEGGDKKPEG
jgi:phage recombination protein Bet